MVGARLIDEIREWLRHARPGDRYVVVLEADDRGGAWSAQIAFNGELVKDRAVYERVLHELVEEELGLHREPAADA